MMRCAAKDRKVSAAFAVLGEAAILSMAECNNALCASELPFWELNELTAELKVLRDRTEAAAFAEAEINQRVWDRVKVLEELVGSNGLCR